MTDRKRFCETSVRALGAAAFTLSFLLLAVNLLPAQADVMQERLAELKESMARNKQALAQYTWKEQPAILVKGQEKKVQHFRKYGA